MLTLLIGGARSGKSALALRAAANWGGPVTFVATAEARDEEMRARIAHHRNERPAAWRTVEEPIELARAIEAEPPDALLIVDCLTLWGSNLLDRGFDANDAAKRAVHAAEAAAGRNSPVIVITNEVGAGIVPDNTLARTYRDLMGAINRAFADVAQRVLLVVAGRALPLSRPEEIEDDIF